MPNNIICEFLNLLLIQIAHRIFMIVKQSLHEAKIINSHFKLTSNLIILMLINI